MISVLLPKPVEAKDPPKPVPESFQGFQATVIGDVCNVRSGPDTSYASVGLVRQGQSLAILDSSGQWYKIKHGSTEGYIANWLVDVDLKSHDINARIIKTDVNIRANPDLTSPIRQMTQKDSLFAAVAKRGDWIKINLEAQSGWIHQTLLQLEYPPETAQNGSEAQCADADICFGVSDSLWGLGRLPSAMVTHTDVNFRAGPGTSCPIVGSLQKGDSLKVISVSDGWVHAISSKGVMGYVADWLVGETSEPPAKAFSVVVDSNGPTRILTVTGGFESAVVVPGGNETSLIISTSMFFGTQAVLPVNRFEFSDLIVGTSDVTVNLRGKANYRVITNLRGKVVLEFFPIITAIDIKPQSDGDVLTVSTLGYATPTVAKKGDSMEFFIPGAAYVGAPVMNQGASVKCLSVIPKDGGTSVLLDTKDASYLIKQSDNLIQVRFPKGGLSGRVIVLDPGHEAQDPGALGPTGLAERNVNWEIANAAAEKLRNAGATVYITRAGLYDVSYPPANAIPIPGGYSGSLAKRAAWGQIADIFISLHNDWNYNSSVNGTTAYLTSNTPYGVESKKLASLLLKHITSHLGTQSKGVREAEYFVTRECYCPSVLVEVMFLSNASEELRLKQPSTWDQAAMGILSAVQEYFEGVPVAPNRPLGI